jgi:hypothetical protein
MDLPYKPHKDARTRNFMNRTIEIHGGKGIYWIRFNFSCIQHSTQAK